MDMVGRVCSPSNQKQAEAVVPTKDADRELPVPSSWRSTFQEIVQALVDNNYQLTRGISNVDPVSADTAEHIRSYVEEYGEVLSPLPDETWQSSVSQWSGSHWNVIVDLWTEGEGASDLVLQAFVRESEGGYRFDIHMVYVP